MGGTQPWERAVAQTGVPDLLEVLVGSVGGADLTSILMEVQRRRASAIQPADVLRRYGSDRFVAPAAADLDSLRAAEDALLAEVPSQFAKVALSPVVPLGTHSVLADVDQNRVVSTVRGSDVAADATNGLALEAMVRRRAALAVAPRSADLVRLATVQRVLRAQSFEGPASYAHFGLFAAVTAGRDVGDMRFERAAVAEHLGIVTRALAHAGVTRIRVEFSDFTGGSWAPVMAAVGAVLVAVPGVEVVSTEPNAPGGVYYRGLRFQVYASSGDGFLHLGDGGLVDWSQKALENRKERLLISGVGVDRFSLIRLESQKA